MEFGIKDVVYLMGIAVSVAGSFFGTRHKLKEYFRDKIDAVNNQHSQFSTDIRKENKETQEKLTDEISSLKLKLKDLESRDEVQQQVINQIGKTNDNLIPKLLELVKIKEQVL
ncbi:hypothetical protein ACXR6G_05795 [Ancylomarina sp. YFZ004]